MKTPQFSLNLFTGILLFLPVLASATPILSRTLIGDEVSVQWHYPESGTVFREEVVTVGSGIEIDCPRHNNRPGGICSGFDNSRRISFDIQAASISIFFELNVPTQFGQTAFNGFFFQDLDWAGPFELSGITLSTDINELDSGDLSFGADFVSIDFGINSGVTLSDGNFLTIFLDVQEISEPDGSSFVALGLLGLWYGRRMKASKATHDKMTTTDSVNGRRVF